MKIETNGEGEKRKRQLNDEGVTKAAHRRESRLSRAADPAKEFAGRSKEWMAGESIFTSESEQP